jgi:hypothetical protein
MNLTVWKRSVFICTRLYFPEFLTLCGCSTKLEVSEAQNRISIINVESCGHSTLEVFFEYVYLGEIHFEKLEEVQEVIEFWHLAGYYEDEYAVKSCARMILKKSLIGPDNLLSFRKEAEKLDSMEVLTALKELQTKYPKHYPQE